MLSGDAAFRAVVDWVEAHSNWDETAVILTADHGHYLHLVDATALVPTAPAEPNPAAVKTCHLPRAFRACDRHFSARRIVLLVFLLYFRFGWFVESGVRDAESC